MSVKQYAGVALIMIGALLFLISYLTGWLSSNLLLLSGLVLIILGVIMHVRWLKRREKY